MRYIAALSALVIIAGLTGCPKPKTEGPPPKTEQDLAFDQSYMNAVMLYDINEIDAAADTLVALYERMPDYKRAPEALFLAGNFSYAAEKYEECVKLHSNFINTFPNSPKAPQAYREAGFALLQLKKYEDIPPLMDEMVERYPDDENVGFAYKYKAIALTFLDRQSEARKLFLKAAEYFDFRGDLGEAKAAREKAQMLK